MSPDEADEISSYVHDMWVDTYAPIVYGGRKRAEDIFDDWVGPNKIRADMEKGFFFAYLIDGGETVGLISAGKEGDDFVISKVYIAPEYRKKGYGRACMDYILQRGRELSCRRAVLEVNPRNQTAMEFYHNLGFEPVGRKEYDHSHTDILGLELRGGFRGPSYEAS